MRSVVPIHPAPDVVPLQRFELHDLDTVRLLLRGSSVVDWYRLHFRNREEIDAFLRVNEIFADDPIDRARLGDILRRAVKYLREHLRYRVPPEIEQVTDIHLLFEYASGTRGRRKDRLWACVVLKVMHIIHHVDAYELLSMLPMSHAEMCVLVTAKIERVVRGLLERGFPIVEYSGNTKAPYSVWSKLLAKKNTLSAQVFDRLRFRFVTERLEDIPPLLIALIRELTPFNYTMPSQADNTLVDLDRLLVRAGNQVAIRAQRDDGHELNEEAAGDLAARKNEFSGPDYRVVNFVAEVPLKIDGILSLEAERLRGLGRVVFTAVEFQVVDQVTSAANESGENKHSLYKQRQRAKVKERLERGKRRKVRGSEGAPEDGEGDAADGPSGQDEDGVPEMERRELQ